MAAELSVSLWRGGEDGRYETCSAPRCESQTVLDVVTCRTHVSKVAGGGSLENGPLED
jgi:hypothetical protein